jgi:WD40 repeat protein
LALWRGPALAGFADQPSLLAEATRLDDLRLEAQEDRVEGLLAIGAQARAIGELEVLLARHPLRESLWGKLMLACYREGRQADALGVYQRAREILADELGVDPSPELTRLHERVLRHDPGLELRGEPLRGYRLLEKIHDGPTGVVFRAIQPRVERDVTVKIFHDDIAADPSFVRRFEQEAQVVAALEHPHIVPIYDYWREPGRAYIVSRYLRGGSLKGLQERGGSTERDRTLRMVNEVASALAFAHRQGVSHGSVGPSNVLFDGEGNAYLGDFVVGIGPAPDPASDVRAMARLARDLLADDMPSRLGGLIEAAELPTDVPRAERFAEAARAELEGTAFAEPRRGEARNPYKGLRPFTEADARDFFGRGELTQRLVARFRDAGPGSRFLAVVGPSGSGKSSVVRAGLVPAVRHGGLGDPEHRFIAEMSPGAHPIEELEAALLRIAVRPTTRLRDMLDTGSRGLLQAVDLLAPDDAEVLLVVDQFEEVFTLCADERERERFLESLRVATVDPESRLRVVLTLRADFYDRPLTYPRFGELLAATTEAVPPLTPDELEQAIREPAERVGVTPEPGLIAEMIAEVAHQPGALPLLQYALTELFERRDDDRLTLAGSREIGGVAGALSARADRIHEGADAEERRAIKQVFLRLVTLGEGTQDTRRRVVRGELDALEVRQEAIDAVLDAFGRHRFITFDRDPATREPTVEIAHEALLGAWGRLRSWIEGAREDLRQERRLTHAAAEWQGSDRDPSFLMRGARLEQVATWEASTDLAIGQHERVYLKASLDRRGQERAEEDDRRRREARLERRSRTRLRALVAVFAVAALVAGSLSIVATSQRQRADGKARIARSRELASAAEASLGIDPERSVLLAMEAIRSTRSYDGTVLREAEQALRDAVAAQRVLVSIPGMNNFDYSPDGRRLVAHLYVEEAGSRDAAILDADSGRTLVTLRGRDGPLARVAVSDVDWSPRGDLVGGVSWDGTVRIWDPRDGSTIRTISSGEESTGWLEFSPDGERVATSGRDGAARIWDVPSGKLLTTLGISDGEADGLAWSPDGRRLAVAAYFDRSGVWDVDSKRVLWRAPFGGGYETTWSPDGGIVVTSGEMVDGWDARTGRHLFTLFPPAKIVDLEFSDDGHLLAGGAEDGTTRVWEISRRGGRETLVLPGGDVAVISGVTFSPDGRDLATGSGGFSAGGATARGQIWDVTAVGGVVTIPDGGDSGDGGQRLAYSPDGSSIALARWLGGFSVWNVVTGERRRSVDTSFPAVAGVDFGPDGATVAASGSSFAGIWDLASGREVRLEPIGDDWVASIDISPDGTRVVTGSKEARLWDARSGDPIRTLLPARRGYYLGARFSPDGRLIATVEGFPGGVQLIDSSTGDVVQTLIRASDARGRSVAFSPDGRLVAAGFGDGTLHVWTVSGREVFVVPTQAGEVISVAFDPTGTRIATGGSDGLVKLWDSRTGRNLLTLAGQSGEVHGVAFSPDGTKLASSAHDGAVWIWPLSLDRLLEVAREHLTKPLTDDECHRYLHVSRCPSS